MAEYVDTVGNRLVHPSPELATAYHSIECGTVDQFQAYQMLRFTETTLRNERTMLRGGRLAWSSDWYPQNYSSCGLYPAENAHLAWAYYQCGQAPAGFQILTGLVDGHFLGRFPGTLCHCATASGFTDGAPDFTDVVSTYLRLLVEGLFGIRFHLLDGRIDMAPQFPPEWDHASLATAEISLRYERSDREETFIISCPKEARRVLRVPLRSARVERVTVNGRPVVYLVEPGIGCSYCLVDAGTAGESVVTIVHGTGPVPRLQWPREVDPGQAVAIGVTGGMAEEWADPSGFLAGISGDAAGVRGTVQGAPGEHTVFLLVRSGEWKAWLPADFTVRQPAQHRVSAPADAAGYEPVDIASLFNESLTGIHELEYRAPRPSGFSLMTRLNGRFAWDWNQRGYNAVAVDDSALRGCGGLYRVASGIPFATPAAGPDAACVSVWENFPDEIVFPLSGRGNEIAVLFIGITNPMQSRVENGWLEVRYRDGGTGRVGLVNPENFDDWLNAPCQERNESVQFSEANHAIVQRIVLDPSRDLAALAARAVANEVIIGVLAISVHRVRGSRPAGRPA
jgi:hypothetical protein